MFKHGIEFQPLTLEDALLAPQTIEIFAVLEYVIINKS